jgi:hypothetical protein
MDMSIENTPLLKKVLIVDAAAGLGAGALMMMGSSFLASLLALPQDLLFWAGVALLGCVALIATMAFRAVIPRFLLLDLALINAVWAAASLAILALGLVQPNLLGYAFVVAQALLVGGLAAVQFAFLRRGAEAVA